MDATTQEPVVVIDEAVQHGLDYAALCDEPVEELWDGTEEDR